MTQMAQIGWEKRPQRMARIHREHGPQMPQIHGERGPQMARMHGERGPQMPRIHGERGPQMARIHGEHGPQMARIHEDRGPQMPQIHGERGPQMARMARMSRTGARVNAIATRALTTVARDRAWTVPKRAVPSAPGGAAQPRVGVRRRWTNEPPVRSKLVRPPSPRAHVSAASRPTAGLPFVHACSQPVCGFSSSTWRSCQARSLTPSVSVASVPSAAPSPSSSTCFIP